MPRKKAVSTIKPTTMRIPPDLLKRADRLAKRMSRSRSWLINRFIREGLVRVEHEVAKAPGALD